MEMTELWEMQDEGHREDTKWSDAITLINEQLKELEMDKKQTVILKFGHVKVEIDYDYFTQNISTTKDIVTYLNQIIQEQEMGSQYK